MELTDDMEKILAYLNKHGESLDTEIAVATRLPLNKVHLHLHELMAKKEVMTLHATRYVDCIKSDVMICRLAKKGQEIMSRRKSNSLAVN